MALLLLIETAIEEPAVERIVFTYKADNNDSLIVFHIKSTQMCEMTASVIQLQSGPVWERVGDRTNGMEPAKGGQLLLSGQIGAVVLL